MIQLKEWRKMSGNYRDGKCRNAEISGVVELRVKT